MSDDWSFNLPKVEHPAVEKTEDTSRGFGQVLSDFAEGAITRAAESGSIKALPLALLFGGIEGAIKGSPSERQAKKEKLDREYKQTLIDQARQSIAHANSRENRAVESHAMNMDNARLQNKTYALQLQQAQWQADVKALTAQTDIFKQGFYNQIGYNNRTFTGQHIINGSKELQQAFMLEAAENLYERDPEQGRRIFHKMGWDILNDGKGGKFLRSLDGKVTQPFDTSRNRIAEAWGSKIQDAVAAADLFEGVQTLQQGSVRNVVTSPDIIKYFSKVDADGKSQPDYVAAYSRYKNFVQNGVKGNKFTEEDLTGHMLSRTLQEALVDKKFSPEEMNVLIPQFDMYLRKFGARVEMGADGNPANAFVILPNGNGVKQDIMSFAEGLKKNDRVMKSFEAELAAEQAAKQLKAIEVAKAQADLRYKNALAANKEKEVGGNSGAVSETADLDDTSKGLYNAGEKGLKEYGVSIPAVEGKSKSDLTIVFGTALTLAKQKFAETGSYSDAQKTLASELDSVDWPKNEIPDLWSAAGEEQEIKMLEERNRVLRDKLNEDRKAGNFKSEMVTTADDPGAGDIDKAIPRSVRIESKTSREYKRNIDRIGELRKKLHWREQSKKQAAEYRKKSKEAGHLLSKAAKDKR